MIYGYIYKLFCLDTREMYIGSTIDLKQRINSHKHNKKNVSSRQIINRNNYIFLILMEGKFVNKDHLKIIENDFISRLPCINIIQAIQILNLLKKQCEYVKKFYHKNKNSLDFKKIQSRIKKQYYDKNANSLKDYQKQYRSENKEKIKLRGKKYWERNKQKLNEKTKEKISCEFCGILGNRNHKQRHLKICKSNPNNLS